MTVYIVSQSRKDSEKTVGIQSTAGHCWKNLMNCITFFSLRTRLYVTDIYVYRENCCIGMKDPVAPSVHFLLLEFC